MHRIRFRSWSIVTAIGVATAILAILMTGPGEAAPPGPAAQTVSTPFAVLGYNNLGMHCMNQDFSEMLILPPYNTIRAQVIDRTHGSPEIVTSGISMEFSLPSNTRSVDKTNFWTYAPAVLGVNLPPNIGLTGNGMSGNMVRAAGLNYYTATGIPVTPIEDTGRENPYPLATITAKKNGVVMGTTQIVVPVSWEISCNICHKTPGISTATDILRAHDRLHATNLEASKPVLCAGCHADNALGAPGVPGVSNFSSAMHTSHAPRMAQAGLTNECYACHPGIRTLCQRDVHAARGMSCNDCHISMAAVGDPARNPWVDQPSCGGCHQAGHPTWEFEEPGKLYQDSRGHRNILCASCHGSPHAITPAITAADNVQAITAQGHPGKIDTCVVCHSSPPDDPFPHRRSDD